MKKLGSILLILLLLSGCQAEKLSVPPSMKDTLIVSNLKKPEISFVDLQKGKLTAGELSFRITSMEKINRDTIILAGENEDSLYRLQLKDGTLTKLSQTGKGINELLYRPKDHLLFFSNGSKNTVGFYDVQKDKVKAEVKTGEFPASMALNEKKNLLYVVNVKGGSLSIINIKTKKEISQFPIVERPKGIFFDGKYIWAGGHGPYGSLNDNIYVYDPETGEEVDHIKAGEMPVGFYGDHSSPYVYAICHGSSSVYRIDRKKRTVSKPLKVGANPYDIIGDKKRIYVTSLDGDSLSIIARDDFTITKQIRLENGPHMMILGEENE
ncbi:YncE family protein [Neobacillus mesonae]|uniref:YncE family protein n=1 Tax=Neobacillus mesonae TaxID=1193713 RepID=UPI00203CDF64|nr:YncE family protein [Neobacillus mesonae]MCM3570536.1 YncE family protein [Neobacillus mesonae]